MESVVSRLKGVRPAIEEILATSGAVGLSYGIIHHGQVVHTEDFGYRDLKNRLPFNSKTMLLICSMTKGLVTSVLGDLVEQRKLEWDNTIKDLLPEYAPQSADLKEKATRADILSIRSGMERYNI